MKMKKEMKGMTAADLADKLEMTKLTTNSEQNNNVTGVYCGDLLSWVMSHAKKGDAWITVHTHLNIVAVALLVEAACVILPEDIRIEEATRKKAEQQGVVILGSALSAYEISWRIHEILH